MLLVCATIGRNQGPRFAAFFGCMYYAKMRPSEVSTSLVSASDPAVGPALARRVGGILAGRPVPDRRVRAATASVVRYLLRASGRPTPFGLFAGVAAGGWADRTQAVMGSRHRAVLKCDSQWMSDIITRLEAQQELLERLDVMFSNLAVRRGSRLELRAPMTETDALGHLLGQLHTAGASTIRGLVPLLVGLNAVHRDLLRHDVQSICGQTVSRARLSASMRRLAVGGRPPLCADMLLDCTVRLPTSVASDLAAAASVLTRLSPNPVGPPEWAGFHELFAERYGVGALVPLLDVLDPGTGLGFPAGYPGSVLPAPPAVTGSRDERLAAMAWRAPSHAGRCRSNCRSRPCTRAARTSPGRHPSWSTSCRWASTGHLAGPGPSSALTS